MMFYHGYIMFYVIKYIHGKNTSICILFNVLKLYTSAELNKDIII